MTDYYRRKYFRREYRFPNPYVVEVVRNGKRRLKSLWNLTWWD